jgi:hypothetical protein
VSGQRGVLPRETAANCSYTDKVTIYNCRISDKQWQRTRQFVIQRDRGYCLACGHYGSLSGKGMAIDHDPVPLAECEVKGVSPYDASNLKLIHHDPCPTCSAAAAALGNRWSGRCNSAKGALSMARFRQKAANATGLVIVGVQPQAGNSRRSAEPAEQGERPWLRAAHDFEVRTS